ncbi:MAG: sugar ABC transporter permease [Meiothermus sp.]|uniref:carbohydrate ABC transporter permease n=1 Tax=Meiothermus sp. TaxID=1955249 RepID=UPI0026002343|nr:sugar ABC transporter permease [Meiothermus sp.]MCS7058814.1 sugar ABC transporter permease [Meiothermus sp.]MCS7194663.1 sugar ABC transporter permease [Meiothermus sp.]
MRHKVGRLLTPYLFLAPNMLIFGIFVVLPMVYGLVYSFYRGNFIGGLQQFVGIENYRQLLEDRAFLNSLAQTVVYVLLVVSLVVVISLMLAIALRTTTLGSALARVGFYLPVILSPVVVGVAWRWMFSSDLGVINALLSSLGQSPIPWLTDINWARAVVVLASVWSMVGFYMVIFIGGLNTIPTELYQAAEVDGASPRQQFWQITLPLLAPTTLLVTILATINAFKAFEIILVLTNGGPGDATRLLVQNIYLTAFEGANPTYASAQSVVLFAILMVLTLMQLRVSRDT